MKELVPGRSGSVVLHTHVRSIAQDAEEGWDAGLSQ
jgi:hypothetical protein